LEEQMEGAVDAGEVDRPGELRVDTVEEREGALSGESGRRLVSRTSSLKEGGPRMLDFHQACVSSHQFLIIDLAGVSEQMDSG
jgi:hypothetical protein